MDAPVGGANGSAPGATGTSPGRRQRRRTYVVAGILAAIGLAVAAVVIWNVTLAAEPVVAATSTTTAPAPTASGAPADHGHTPFTSAQPGTVTDHVLTGIAELTGDDRVGDPIEAWALTYTGPDGWVKVVAAQWPDREGASEAFKDVLASQRDGAQGTDDLGSVGAQGQSVGHAWLIARAEGQGVLIWQNTTAVFTLAGPTEALYAFQQAYPL